MNLKDRMKSAPENQSLSVTMMNSTQQSLESLVQEQAEVIQKQMEKIQTLSSENSTLKNVLREKSATIVSLKQK